MVNVLMLVREHGAAQVEFAVRGALACGAHDGRAVGVLARQTKRPPTATLDDLPAHLDAIERPEPTLADYDRLLTLGGRR